MTRNPGDIRDMPPDPLALETALRAAERTNNTEDAETAALMLIEAHAWQPVVAYIERLKQRVGAGDEVFRHGARLVGRMATLTESGPCDCHDDLGRPWHDCPQCGGSGRRPPRRPPPNPLPTWMWLCHRFQTVPATRVALVSHFARQMSTGHAERLVDLASNTRVAAIDARQLAWHGWATINVDGSVQLGPVCPALPEPTVPEPTPA